jgi:hypothetical protein
MAVLKDGALRIDDVLPFLPDFAKIGEFKVRASAGSGTAADVTCLHDGALRRRIFARACSSTTRQSSSSSRRCRSTPRARMLSARCVTRACTRRGALRSLKTDGQDIQELRNRSGNVRGTQRCDLCAKQVCACITVLRRV